MTFDPSNPLLYVLIVMILSPFVAFTFWTIRKIVKGDLVPKKSVEAEERAKNALFEVNRIKDETIRLQGEQLNAFIHSYGPTVNHALNAVNEAANLGGPQT